MDLSTSESRLDCHPRFRRPQANPHPLCHHQSITGIPVRSMSTDGTPTRSLANLNPPHPTLQPPSPTRRLGPPTRDAANEALLKAFLAKSIRPPPASGCPSQTTALVASQHWQHLTQMLTSASSCPRTGCMVLYHSSTLLQRPCRHNLKVLETSPVSPSFWCSFCGCSGVFNLHRCHPFGSFSVHFCASCPFSASGNRSPGACDAVTGELQPIDIQKGRRGDHGRVRRVKPGNTRLPTLILCLCLLASVM